MKKQSFSLFQRKSSALFRVTQIKPFQNQRQLRRTHFVFVPGQKQPSSNRL
jgi:hypothetical protein